jgi:hypothetical protein
MRRHGKPAIDRRVIARHEIVLSESRDVLIPFGNPASELWESSAR